MPQTVLLLGGVGLFGVALAAIGLYRRRLVVAWRVHRDEQPAVFWLGFTFQLGLGLVCLGLAAIQWASAAE